MPSPIKSDPETDPHLQAYIAEIQRTFAVSLKETPEQVAAKLRAETGRLEAGERVAGWDGPADPPADERAAWAARLEAKADEVVGKQVEAA